MLQVTIQGNLAMKMLGCKDNLGIRILPEVTHSIHVARFYCVAFHTIVL